MKFLKESLTDLFFAALILAATGLLVAVLTRLIGD